MDRLHDRVKKIERGTFQNCNSLRRLIIPYFFMLL